MTDFHRFMNAAMMIIISTAAFLLPKKSYRKALLQSMLKT